MIESEEIEELQKALEKKTAQLEATQQELERFSYSVSHDLRAPLRAIEGFAKILGEDYSDKIDEDGQRYLKILEASGQKMTRMLDELLQLSRLSRQEMSLSSVDMTELVQTVWNELREKDAARKIEFKLNALPGAWGDASLLHRVWTNLISNAIKFSAPRKKAMIEISGESEPDRVQYCITDNGVGFDSNVTSKLFGVFQRLHTEQEFSGCGMGLAIARRLVRRHAGEIWAQAKKNEGATFRFSLPRVDFAA